MPDLQAELTRLIAECDSQKWRTIRDIERIALADFILDHRNEIAITPKNTGVLQWENVAPDLTIAVYPLIRNIHTGKVTKWEWSVVSKGHREKFGLADTESEARKDAENWIKQQEVQDDAATT